MKRIFWKLRVGRALSLKLCCKSWVFKGSDRQKVKESCSTAVPLKGLLFSSYSAPLFILLGALHIWVKNEIQFETECYEFTHFYCFLFLLFGAVYIRKSCIKDISCLYFLCPAFYKFKSLPHCIKKLSWGHSSSDGKLSALQWSQWGRGPAWLCNQAIK